METGPPLASGMERSSNKKQPGRNIVLCTTWIHMVWMEAFEGIKLDLGPFLARGCKSKRRRYKLGWGYPASSVVYSFGFQRCSCPSGQVPKRNKHSTQKLHTLLLHLFVKGGVSQFHARGSAHVKPFKC